MDPNMLADAIAELVNAGLSEGMDPESAKFSFTMPSETAQDFTIETFAADGKSTFKHSVSAEDMAAAMDMEESPDDAEAPAPESK